MDELKLNCWARCEDSGGVFQVEVSKTKTVFDLQEAIKNKKEIRDAAAYALPLYKPTAPVTCTDNLSKLILSDHAEFLEGVYELSEIFPEPPPKYGIHIIVDMPSQIVCWFRGATHSDSFRLPIHPGENIADLIPRIKDAQPGLKNIANDLIRLYRISGDENELQECLNRAGGGEPIQGVTLMTDFLGIPVLGPLRVVIEVSAIGGNSPTLVRHRDALQEYKNINLKVKRLGWFEKSDIERNQIVQAQNTSIPKFVTTFERRFIRKPHLPLHAQMLGYGMEAYFKDWIAEDESQEEVRYAEPSEVIHTTYITIFDWQESWQSQGPYKHPFKDTAKSIFFHAFLHTAKNRMSTALRNESWPLNVVVKRDSDDELRKYCPSSDLRISNTTLPRLLVEFNSTSQNLWPMELIRMLTTGAFVVRFANNFVSTFSQEKNFVICAFFIRDNGTATRYTLFQQRTQNDETVYYNTQEFSLNGALGRAEFVRHLYALLSMESDENQNQAEKDAIDKLHSKIRGCKLKSMYTGTSSGQNNIRGRVRTDSNGNNGDSGGDGDDLARLRAHGYEVEPEVIVDASGGVWESLSEMPDHIHIVYRLTNTDRQFIAKKIRKKSNELEIFRLLDSIRPKSDHVISLVDSFDGWAILPKMVDVLDYVDRRRISTVFETKISQVCLGLIKGVAFLHDHHIAHRDIKPDNLVIDRNHNLKVIDFDIAMHVRDENEEVDDQRGTEGWKAPEIVRGSRHKPIMADRWACGQVILFLLDAFRKQDKSLKAFAKDLALRDPEQRPSLLEWGRYLAPALSDAGNTGNSVVREAMPHQEVNRDDTTPPNAKKRKVDSDQCSLGSEIVMA